MRETRLFDYGNPHDSGRISSADIVFTTSDLDGLGLVRATWAGLVNDTVAWRVEEGEALIFENILTRKGLRLNLSSPLTCRPLFRAGVVESSKAVDGLLSCYLNRSGCVLLRIRVTIPPASSSATMTCEEMSRQSLPATFITCMADVDGDSVVGRTDGSCAHVKFPNETPTRMNFIPFAPHAMGSSENRSNGEDTSMVSGVSDESAPSHRSVASSMSFGLMTRLFGSPRGNSNAPGRHPMEATSHAHGQASSAARRSREDKAPYKSTMDKVLCVAKVKLELKALVSLHQSGRLCVYTATETSYQYVADIVLPVTLSVGIVNHFLLTGPNESVIAAVMADEDPNADSLRVFNVTAKIRGERSIALSTTQIAVREGPVDRVVSACFTGEDVIVGSETGFISGVLNVPNDLDDGSGIPTGTLWTALDEMEQPFGLAQVLDNVSQDPRDQLLQAHRFSVNAVAKALRLENPGLVSRAEIEEAVKNTVFDHDADNMWHRVKARADQITKSEDLLIRDLCVVEGLGVVVGRQHSLSVFRGLLEAEQKTVENRAHLLLNKEPITLREPGWMLSSHGACQVIASQYSIQNIDAEAKSKLRSMLTTATSFSGVERELPLTDQLAWKWALRQQEEDIVFSDLSSAISSTLSTLEPGPSLLLFLQSSSEMEFLLVAAEQTGDNIPVSSMFASGMSWLWKAQRTSYSTTDSRMDRVSIAEQNGSEHAALMLDKAYAFFITASEWCTSGTEVAESDVRCAIRLAGLTSHQIEAAQQFDGRNDVAMTDVPGGLPDGPDTALFRENLGFWLLERSVRLLESSGAPKSAAAAALEAMRLAPDRKRHEMMRAAAFTRFLDAGDLEHALKAILSQPYVSEENADAALEESGALRDAVGLFVDSAASRGVLQWLAECNLPEPLYVLCGLALERRARAADALSVRQDIRPQSSPDAYNRMTNIAESEDYRKPVSEYEQLYSWHILRGDGSSAASSALEWGERLSNEGLTVIRNAIASDAFQPSVDQQLKLLLSWTKAKCEAWAYALSACQLEPIERRYVVRSRFSLVADPSMKPGRGVVSESWVSRRHLLAHAQSRVLTEMLSEAQSDATRNQFVPFLISPDSILLSAQREGLGWIASMLAMYPSYDNMLLCAELGSAWREESGEGLLTEVIKRAASLASQQAVMTFGYPDLDELLRGIVSTGGEVECSRNWNLVALESALSTSAGAVACPQWLVDAAAWGTAAFAEGTTITERFFSGRRRGDAAGVVRTLLRNHRPVDAAKLLIVGLASQGKTTHSGGTKEAFYVPYSAIDATMEMLAQCADDYPDAEVYRQRLEACTTTHISKMDERMQNKVAESMEVVAS